MDLHKSADKAWNEEISRASHSSLALALSAAIAAGEKWKILSLNGPGFKRVTNSSGSMHRSLRVEPYPSGKKGFNIGFLIMVSDRVRNTSYKAETKCKKEAPSAMEWFMVNPMKIPSRSSVT
uniref:Uncharacterized protein n=1 Tax=Opuntia streptacantha TaxID=393608 RepID=A0A7C9D886_OPUST